MIIVNIALRLILKVCTSPRLLLFLFSLWNTLLLEWDTNQTFFPINCFCTDSGLIYSPYLRLTVSGDVFFDYGPRGAIAGDAGGENSLSVGTGDNGADGDNTIPTADSAPADDDSGAILLSTGESNEQASGEVATTNSDATPVAAETKSATDIESEALGEQFSEFMVEEWLSCSREAGLASNEAS